MNNHVIPFTTSICRDVEKLLFRSQRINMLFQKMLKNLSGSVLVLGSRILDLGNDHRDVDERLTSLSPYNRIHITEVLVTNDLDCDDLGTICKEDFLRSNYIEEIVLVPWIKSFEESKVAEGEAAVSVKPETKTETTVTVSKSEAETSALMLKDGDSSVPA